MYKLKVEKMEKVLLIVIVFIFMGCVTDADIASQNLSKDAEFFKVLRRVVFYNGIIDKYILLIEGYCSVEFYHDKFEVTVKTPEGYKKHYLGRADNVFPFVEQLDAKDVSTDYYKVVFKPKSIINFLQIVNQSCY